ncbi:hypothetical protein E4634_00380 [Mangrovimicrobium sediminis]|uniref:DUF2846 domain-containing protein n=1 Tax=Mangrovimicrobium sediminis TaxID=2562682 RepID=A0A4Z0M982_9GAMM|nr:hypothetical protein [Haliea sp. SAOS-164]TGD76044.1 hypothetical protein E4634_00380 [Haliea sp. SAOS-164]
MHRTIGTLAALVLLAAGAAQVVAAPGAQSARAERADRVVRAAEPSPVATRLVLPSAYLQPLSLGQPLSASTVVPPELATPVHYVGIDGLFAVGAGQGGLEMRRIPTGIYTF